MTWSLAMIVKNEETVLARCLDSVEGIFDEIIIVDTGSTDYTIPIAKNYTDKIYHFEWVNDFSKARNYAFSKATCDFIMWLDADDYFTPENREKLLEFKTSFDTTVDAVYMKYHIGYDTDGNPTITSKRERLLRREANFKWAEPVHECITVAGRAISSEIAVSHGDNKRDAAHSTRNLTIYEAQETLTDRGVFYYARELKTHQRYKDAIVQFEKFLTDGRGWKEDNIRACYDLFDCYNAIEDSLTGVKFLFQSFLYANPRAETCCKIGHYFLGNDNLHQAVYWYDLALHPNTHEEGGFFNKDFTDYIPTIQLCVLFDKMGLHEKAYEYHLKTKAMKPNHASVAYNEKYFNEKLKGLGVLESELKDPPTDTD